MRILRGSATRWHKRLALVAICVAVTRTAYAGYRVGDSQAAWVALWSFCASVR